jgi:hypothetical protein
MKSPFTTKPFLRFMAIAMFLTLSTLAGQAQANAQCGTEDQIALYNKYVAERTGTTEQQKTAIATGKEYLSKFGECTTEEDKKINKYIKNWQAKYEAAVDEFSCTNAVDNTPAKASQLCGPYLARDPENLRAYLLLSLAGIKNTKTADKNLNAETVRTARKALELIKAGKSVDTWILGDNKDEAASTLEFYSAYLTMDTTPAETAAAMLTLARSNSKYSKDPSTYLYLGKAIQNSEVKKLADEYKQTCTGKESTPECDAAYTKIEGVIDRVIDAYARAVALSEGKPEYAKIAAIAKPALADLYKERHENTDTGLDKLVAEVLSKPIP